MRGGNSESQGVLLRANSMLLEMCNRQRMDICLKASVYNIHGDDQVDLLSGNPGSYSETMIRNSNDIHIALHHALKKRKELGNKKFKERSNMIVSLKLTKGTEILSQADFVELAASEYAQIDKKIARSFNSLINYLTQGAVNWRDSQLVVALRNSLDIYNPYNPSQVLLICCVNPIPSVYKHTYSSLKYTSRIRECVGSEESYNRELVLEEFEMLKRDVMRSSPPQSLTDAAQWLLSREALLFKMQSQLPSSKKQEANLLKAEIDRLRAKWLEHKEDPRDSQVLMSERESLHGLARQDENIQNLQNVIVSKDESIKVLKVEIEDLQSKLSFSKEEIEALLQKNLQLERARSRLEIENESCNRRLEEVKLSNQKQITDLQNVILSEKSILEEIHRSYSQNAKTDRTLEEMRSTLQEKDFSIAKLKSELDDRNRHVERYLQEIQSLTTNSQTLKESKDTLSQQIHELKLDLHKYQSDLKSSTEKISTMKMSISEKDAKFEHIRNKYRETKARDDKTINNLETRLYNYDTDKLAWEKARVDSERQIAMKETERQKEYYLKVQLENDAKGKEEMLNEMRAKLKSKNEKLKEERRKNKVIEESVENIVREFEKNMIDAMIKLQNQCVEKLEGYNYKLIMLQNVQKMCIQNFSDGQNMDSDYINSLCREKEELTCRVEKLKSDLDSIREEGLRQDREISYFKDSPSLRMSISEIETAPASHKKSSSADPTTAPPVFTPANLSPIPSAHESFSNYHLASHSKAQSVKERARLAISEWHLVKESQGDLSSSQKLGDYSSLRLKCNSLEMKLRAIERERDELIEQIAKSSFIRSEISNIHRELTNEKRIKDNLVKENEHLRSYFSSSGMSGSTMSIANRLKKSLKPAPKYDSPEASFSIHYKPLDITYPSQIEELTAEIHRLTADRYELMIRYESEAAEKDLLIEQISKLQSDKSYLESSLQHSQNLIGDYETLIDELRINLLDSADETKKALELKLEYMQQLEEANKTILELKHKYKKERNSTQDEYLKFKQETHRQAEVSDYATSQLESMSLEIVSLKSERDQLIIEKNMLENKLQELSDPLPKLQDRVSAIGFYLNSLADITKQCYKDDYLYPGISSDYSDSDLSHRSDEL
jgi:hypothetical protein